MDNITYGKIGESIATKYLKRNGYKIITNNYHNELGEIDIIAMSKDNTIVFIEVKARNTLSKGYPREAVNEYKQNKIRSVAIGYLKHNKLLDAKCRFDVIEIVGDEKEHKIEHFVDAF